MSDLQVTGASAADFRVNKRVLRVRDVVALWNEWKSMLRDGGRSTPSLEHDNDFARHCKPLLSVCASGRCMLVKSVNGGMRYAAYAMGGVAGFDVESCCEGFWLTVVFENDLEVAYQKLTMHYYEPNSYHAHVLMEESDERKQRGGWRVAPICAYAGSVSTTLRELPESVVSASHPMQMSQIMFIQESWERLSDDFVGPFATSLNSQVSVDSVASHNETSTSSQNNLQARRRHSFARRLAARRAREAVRITQTNVPRRAARMRPHTGWRMRVDTEVVELMVCQPYMCKQMHKFTEDRTCPICMEKTTEKTHRVFTCGHFVCSGCMSNDSFDWTCPLCRGKIRK